MIYLTNFYAFLWSGGEHLVKRLRRPLFPLHAGKWLMSPGYGAHGQAFEGTL